MRAAGNSGNVKSGPGAPFSGSAARPTPEQIFADRLARGEIDSAEYADRLATLHGKVNGKVRS